MTNLSEWQIVAIQKQYSVIYFSKAQIDYLESFMSN